MPTSSEDSARPSRYSRRRFLRMLGVAGGALPVWHTMNAWGMIAASGQDRPPDLGGGGGGRRVIILGAGLAGMAAAFELRANGYDCTVLEARDRPGGRVWSIRSGTRVEEMGREPIVCQFDDAEHLYVNIGPWRIPHHHTSTLHYCRRLNVPLEVFVNDEQAALARAREGDGALAGQRLRLRQLRADMRGHVGELLAKAIDRNALDDEISGEDGEALIEFLVSEVGLDADDLTYTGTGARGYIDAPGAGERPGEIGEPFALPDLLSFSQGLGVDLLGLASYNMQATMLHPVGGMDRIATHFAEEVDELVTYSAEVREIRRNGENDGARVVYEHPTEGEQEVTGDYVVVTIPLTVLHQISNDFSSEVRQAISAVRYMPTGKSGLQFARRFWEEDEGIYGGHGHTPPVTISYQPTGYLSQKGIIQGYYNFVGDAIRVSNGSQQERIEYALQAGEVLHDQYREEFETGIAHAWHLERYSMGGWATWDSDTREQHYQTLLEPDGPFYFAGEHLSYLTGWMAGAIESAWDVIEQIHQRAQRTA